MKINLLDFNDGLRLEEKKLNCLEIQAYNYFKIKLTIV